MMNNNLMYDDEGGCKVQSIIIRMHIRNTTLLIWLVYNPQEHNIP